VNRILYRMRKLFPSFPKLKSSLHPEEMLLVGLIRQKAHKKCSNLKLKNPLLMLQ